MTSQMNRKRKVCNNGIDVCTDMTVLMRNFDINKNSHTIYKFLQYNVTITINHERKKYKEGLGISQFCVACWHKNETLNITETTLFGAEEGKKNAKL